MTLNTSGAVPLRYVSPHGQSFVSTLWSDLSPFEQGYVEALLRGVRKGCAGCGGRGEIGGWVGQTPESGGYETELCPNCPPGFSDLAHETLEMIRRDCTRFAELFGEWPHHDHGKHFWIGRQRDKHPGFPSLVPYLSNDGRVCLREARS